MKQPLVAASVLALGALWLPHCAGRNSPAPSDAAPSDAAVRDVAAPPSRVGLACAGDADCAGLQCLTTLERACSGPIRPHTWRFEFAGGYCHPPVDLPAGNVVGGCPAGTQTLTAFVGCDGIPFRFCTRPCAGDADCRAAEGYRCNLEAMQCYPAQFVTEMPDAGDGGG